MRDLNDIDPIPLRWGAVVPESDAAEPFEATMQPFMRWVPGMETQGDKASPHAPKPPIRFRRWTPYVLRVGIDCAVLPRPAALLDDDSLPF